MLKNVNITSNTKISEVGVNSAHYNIQKRISLSESALALSI